MELGAVPVEFPYEPYECQQKFMRNVLDALQAVSGWNHLNFFAFVPLFTFSNEFRAVL